MKVDLSGKTLLITGSTQGIGLCIAKYAAKAGVDGILITGRDTEKGHAAAKNLQAQGTDTVFMGADMLDVDAPQRLFATAKSHFGRVDLLVNSAGVTTRSSFLDGTLEIWEQLFAINARAPFFLMQAYIADLLKQGKEGSIVNILSMNAHCGSPELGIYSATKGALSTITKNAANAHLADRIRVNGLNVGWVPTEAEILMQAQTLGKGEDWIKDASATLPLGRLLTPDEVAKATLFYLSDLSGLTTGTLLDLEQSVVGAPHFHK